jgi:hypothetical protein
MVSPISLKDFGINKKGIAISISWFGIVSIFLTVLTHELIHLIFKPNFIKSDKTCIGLTPFGGYVYSEEVITKSRYIFISTAPFIIISIIVPLVLGNLGLLDKYNKLMKFLVLINSMGSSVDILYLILILFQGSFDSYVTSNGMNTYWKNT